MFSPFFSLSLDKHQLSLIQKKIKENRLRHPTIVFHTGCVSVDKCFSYEVEKIEIEPTHLNRIVPIIHEEANLIDDET